MSQATKTVSNIVELTPDDLSVVNGGGSSSSYSSSSSDNGYNRSYSRKTIDGQVVFENYQEGWG
jgi:hypothetical protein